MKCSETARLDHAGKSVKVRIRASSGWQPLNIAELWRFRELIWFLALRDVKLRYKQTALGVAWTVLQPLLATIVFTIFSALAKISSDGLPYSLFALTGLLPWQLFSFALTQSSNSLVNEQRSISKVYFPRLIVPLASVLSGLVDFGVTFVMVIVWMFWWQIPLSWGLLAIPFLLLFAPATVLLVGLWLSALNVRYRDVRYTIPFLTQFGCLCRRLSTRAQWFPKNGGFMGLNPMAGVVEGFRWALLGTAPPDPEMLAASAASILPCSSRV